MSASWTALYPSADALAPLAPQPLQKRSQALSPEQTARLLHACDQQPLLLLGPSLIQPVPRVKIASSMLSDTLTCMRARWPGY